MPGRRYELSIKRRPRGRPVAEIVQCGESKPLVPSPRLLPGTRPATRYRWQGEQRPLGLRVTSSLRLGAPPDGA